jgi:A/G-specific adenine glycosylase
MAQNIYCALPLSKRVIIAMKTIKTGFEKDFTRLLLKWNKQQNTRQMPWKGEKDPYKIWLSEIILQQTRVEQGLSYYNKFITAFSTITSLADAPDQKIFKFWEGLGYYTRCRNLIATARFISKEKKGIFPKNFDEIKSLKGIGPYTAAAISSFAFNQPYAVVDGNVFRVLARVFGIKKAIDTTEGKKYFTALAERLLDKMQPGLYNQAIMDFGAVVCKPASPLCASCVFKKNCSAFLTHKINELPVKNKKPHRKQRWFYYFVIDYKKHYVLSQRKSKDIWQQLFEFPLVETGKAAPLKEVLKKAEKEKMLTSGAYEIKSVTPVIKQQLTHQLIQGQLIYITAKAKPPLNGNSLLVPISKIKNYAFPRFISLGLALPPGK